MARELKFDVHGKNLKNALWSLCDYLVLPILMLAFTPYFVRKLGLAQFGVWMLVNNIVAIMSVLNLGFGEATTKFVSQYRACNNTARIDRIIRSSLTVSFVLSLVLFGCIHFGAVFLAKNVFRIDNDIYSIAIESFKLGGIILASKSFDYVLTSALRGLERYDLSSRIAIIIKLSSITSSVVILKLGFGLEEVLLANVITSTISVFMQIAMLRRSCPDFMCLPLIDEDVLRESWSFGRWSWLLNLTGTITSQLDKFFIGVCLGTSYLAVYSICCQVAQQIHSLLAATSSFVFPLSSFIYHKSGMIDLHRLYAKAILSIAVLMISLAIPLYVFAPNILTAWIGAEFARSNTILFQFLTLSFGGYALTIVPHYILNGTENIRVNVIFGLVSSCVIAGGLFFFLPKYGVVGVALAHLLNMLQVLAALIFIQVRILKYSDFYSSVIQFATYLLPVILVVLIDRFYNLNQLPVLLLSVLVLAFVVSVGSIVYRYSDSHLI